MQIFDKDERECVWFSIIAYLLRTPSSCSREYLGKIYKKELDGITRCGISDNRTYHWLLFVGRISSDWVRDREKRLSDRFRNVFHFSSLTFFPCISRDFLRWHQRDIVFQRDFVTSKVSVRRTFLENRLNFKSNFTETANLAENVAGDVPW